MKNSGARTIFRGSEYQRTPRPHKRAIRLHHFSCYDLCRLYGGGLEIIMTNYTYAAAYVRTLETCMLTDADMRELMQCNDSAELLQSLEKRGYEGDTLSDALENELEKTWQICTELCGDDEPMAALMAENDFYNIKAVIKSALAGRDAGEVVIRPTRIDVKLLYDLVKTGDFSALNTDFAEVCAQALKIYAETGDAGRLETYLDRRCAEVFLSESRCNDFLHGYAELTVLIKNLRIFLRIEDKRQLSIALIPCDSIDVTLLENAATKQEALAAQGFGEFYELFAESPAKFEHCCENMIADYIADAKTEFFDFAAVLGYLIGKRTEIRNIREIASGITFGEDAADISERLVKGYV